MKKLYVTIVSLILISNCILSAQVLKPIKSDDPKARLNYELELVKDPITGEVPINSLISAHQTLKKRFKSEANLAISGINWNERGPNNIGGRTRALMFDPNDATNKRVWAGGVSGGLWYNNDITLNNSSWVKIDDFWDNLAISCIAHSPANTNIFYAGTGEGWFNADAVQGGGIWRTTDGGTTWNVLSNTVPNYASSITTAEAAFQTVQKIVVNPAGKVFAATRYGVWQSTDNGLTWTISKTNSTAIGSGLNFVSDLEYVNGVLYAAFGRGSGTSIHKSTDEGVNWTDITPTGVTGGRTEIAVGSSTIYAICDNNFTTIKYFKKSIDGGANWTDLAIPTDASLTTDVTSGQAWYDLILSVHPTNDNLLIIGGASHARTVDGGSSWYCFPYSNPVHPDHHNFVFRPGSPDEVILANDGGVYYSTNYGNASIVGSINAFSFATRNTNFNVMQPYSVAMKNIDNDGYILQGNQDNGTTFMTNAYNTMGSAAQAGGGDGMNCFIDQNEPNIIIGSFQFSGHYSINPTTNKAAFYIVDPNNSAGFLNPCDYDDINNIFYSNAGSPSSGVYTFARSPIVAYNNHTTANVNFNASISGMTVSFIKASPYTAHTIYFGTTSGRLWKVTGMNTASPVATQLVQKSGTVSCIEFGASDNEILLTHSNYNVTSVWYSNDAGVTWIDKDASTHGLPNIPVRFALFNPLNRKEVMLATELGVWSTKDITESNPGWAPTNANLANVRCDMLRFRSADNTIAVATHGRGVFTTKLSICPSNVVRQGTESVSETLLSGSFIKGNTANVIQSGVNKVYSAKDYILLEPNFESVSGSIFTALIGGCN